MKILRSLHCLLGEHGWIEGPPDLASRHCKNCGRFETFEQAYPTRLAAGWVLFGKES